MSQETCNRGTALDAPIEHVRTCVIRIPTDTPESDGTLEWSATTVVICEIVGGRRRGIGYTYAARAAAEVIDDLLAECVVGRALGDVRTHWLAMQQAVRNIGAPGVAATAISAVDTALWDLAAKTVGVPLCRLLGACRDSIAAYGSGGFTSYDDERLRQQLEAWRAEGLSAFKIKIGRDPARDEFRVGFARRIVGRDAHLYVDANGAYTVAEARATAVMLGAHGVGWFEEPVTSDDPAGLARVRSAGPPGMRIAAGEYGYRIDDFKRLLDAAAVDVLMIDATRCGGVTGFLGAAALATAYHVPVSTHCAPTLHRQLACALPNVSSVEYFHDHARIEAMLFDGAASIVDGRVRIDARRPGLGIEPACASLRELARKLHHPESAAD